MNGETHGNAGIPDPGSGGECVISRRDLEILLQSAESEREIGYRNLSTGIAVSCGFGTLCTITPRSGELASVGADPLEAVLLILLTAVTLASSALATFFHRRLRGAGSHGAHRVLNRHIREQLDQPVEPVEPADPRRWP